MDLKKLKNTYFVVGLFLLGTLILMVGLTKVGFLRLSVGGESLVSAVFGWGGIILTVMGIIRAILK